MPVPTLATAVFTVVHSYSVDLNVFCCLDAICFLSQLVNTMIEGVEEGGEEGGVGGEEEGEGGEASGEGGVEVTPGPNSRR